MIYARIQQFFDSIREGIGAGFAAGIVILFLILIGIPVQIRNLALFLLLLVIAIFGIRLARRAHDKNLGYLIWNSLAMGFVAAFMAFALMALVNSWQTKGVDVKQYFDSVTTDTMTVLSGVPEDELFANPPVDPFTGEYVEGEPLRTDPMRLTFDKSTGLHLLFGLTGESWLDVNLIIGGFYGFMLLLIGVGMAGTLLTRGAVYVDIGRYRTRLNEYLTDNVVAHWVVLLLPLIFFAFLWLTEGHGGAAPILSLGSGTQQIQLLISFLIILFGLVAMRAAQSTPWNLTYPVRAGIVLAVVALLAILAIVRVVGSETYFVAPPSSPGGSETLSVLIVVLVALGLAAQNLSALRRPDRFESQFAGSLSIGVLLLMPLYLDQYQNDVMTLVGINILLGLGLNIVVGYAGLLDLGYVAFFALGAYTYAFLSSQEVELDSSNQPIGLKFAGNQAVVIEIAGWVITTAIVASIVIAAGLYVWRRRQASHLADSIQPSRALLDVPARPTGSVTFVLTSLAIVTSLIVALVLKSAGVYDDVLHGASPFLVGLLAGVIVSGLSGIMLGIPVLRLRGDYLAIVTLGFGEIIRLLFNNLRDYTGGPQGVIKIPRPLPEGASGTVTYLAIVYLVFLGAALVAFFSTRLKQSRTGRAWSAMRSDESIAQSMGVNLVQSKLMAFAIGAAFAGVGGVLFAARQRNIFPGDFKLDVSIEVLSLVIIGGMGSIPGVIMGAIVLIGLPEVLRELSTYRILVFGALLVTMVIIRPKGLLPAPTEQLESRARALVHGKKESQT